MDNYNEVLKYIISNLNDMREEIDSTLSYMYKYRIPFQQADRGNSLESAILSAINDYEIDNDYEEDEILDEILSEKDLEDIFFDVVDNLDKQPILRKDKELLESLTRKYGKRYILRTLNESGDTERGQYMIGRLHRRSAQRSAEDDYYRRRNISKEYDNLFKHNKGNWEAYNKGYDDEGIDLPRLKRNAIRANYGTYKMKDMDKLGKQFISFIEKNDAILQLIVDYMSGNQNGKKYSSPLNEVIPEFEDAVLKYETTPDEKKAIERAFNEWWHYAEAELMPDYDEE